MAKTAATASWRTLTRQADKERSPRKASRLRKQAHELRRAEREAATLTRSKRAVKATASNERRTIKSLARDAHKAGLAVQISTIPRSTRATKGWATRRANLAAAQAPATQEGIGPTQDGALVATDHGLPGHGDIVGGALSQLADRIAKLARKKGGTDAIQNELAALAQSSKYEGCIETDKAATKRLIDVQERLAERVVCGFLAEVDQAVHEHRGLPPSMTWVLNSFLVTKLADALNKAGYTSAGMRNTACGQGERAVGR